jgi:DNA-3-methyladenine glycosylase II
MEAALTHLRQADPILAAIIEKVGPYEFVRRDPTFETLVRSIIYQWISGKAAASSFAKLKARVGRRFSPAAVLRLTDEEFRACGVSSQKMNYIRDLAEKAVSRKVVFKKLIDLTDDEVIKHLIQVKGVGVWTAHIFLMFGLERPNIFPLADLSIKAAIRRAYNLPDTPTRAEMLRISAPWHPYCSVATWYLWRSLSGSAEI